MRIEARWSGSGRTPGSWFLRRSHVSRCGDWRDWPFAYSIIAGRWRRGELGASVLALSSAGYCGWDAEVGGDLRQALAEGLANVGEDPGAGVAEFFFGGGGDARDYFARLMVERRDGGEHPLRGDVFEAAAKMFGGLLADARVEAAHLRP